MPWFRVDYSERDLKDKMSEFFEIEGIPTLILLDGNGQVITKEGTGLIMAAPFDQLAAFEAKRLEEEEQAERENAIIATEAGMLLDEVLESLPATAACEHHAAHTLKKNLYVEEGAKCSVCEKHLSAYAYSCAECNYHAHPHCCFKQTDGSFSLLTTVLGKYLLGFYTALYDAHVYCSYSPF